MEPGGILLKCMEQRVQPLLPITVFERAGPASTFIPYAAIFQVPGSYSLRSQRGTKVTGRFDQPAFLGLSNGSSARARWVASSEFRKASAAGHFASGS